jgi:phosphatidylserine/phosphatidylglycerophosphate/cardiolipin synthase-like enzyme
LTGVSLADDHETDVVTALVNARNRGVKIKVLLNGQIAHAGPLPATWDKDFKRPLKEAAQRLKDAWVDVGFVYYHESIYSPLHHKFAAIDGKTCVIGSYNWYPASVVSDEVLLVLRDASLAKALSDEARLIAASYRIGRD